MNKIWLNHLTWPEYQEAAPHGVLILPVGSTEQHNQHLPIGVDTLLSTHLAEDVAKSFGRDCYVAPAVAYGYKSRPASGGGPHFPGTVDLSLETLTSLLTDLLREFLADGWKKILILNGHYENSTSIYEACDALLRGQKTAFPKVITLSWFDLVEQPVIDKVFDAVPFPGWELEHAAIAETSLIMHYEPALCQPEKMVDEGVETLPVYEVFPLLHNVVPPSGSLHTPRSSTACKGAILAENVVSQLLDILEREFSDGYSRTANENDRRECENGLSF